jgi:iron(III) transport system permease protein
MRAWVGVLWAAVLLLPWYGLEHLSWPASMPLVGQMFTGRWWLAPLLLAPALAATRRPEAWVAAAICGIGWLALESLAIIHHGWGFSLIASFGPGPTQPALGWGALVYATACLAIAAYGLAARGWMRGDVFVAASLLLIVGAILLFVAVPVGTILLSAIRDNDGRTALGEFAGKMFDKSIWGISCITSDRACGVAWNSLELAIIVGVLSTLLGLAFALIAQRTRFPFPGLLRLLSLLPVITPPFVIGLALILMFGRAGFITNFLYQHLDIPRSRWLYGMAGVAIAQILAFTPIAFLVLLGVLQGVAPSLEEAASTLRASRWRIFRTVTWPLIRPGLANAFLIGFIESLADFGNPLILAGNFNVLATDIFFAVVGAAHDQGRAAVLALVLLVFTLGAFLAQNRWVGGRNYTSVSGKGDSGIPARLPRGLHGLCLGVVLPWLVLTILVYGIIVVGGFVESIGRDNSFTWKYFLIAFSIDKGVSGWFMSGSAWSSFITTLELSALAMPLTAAIGLLTAWLIGRQTFRGRGAFEFLTMMSFAVPGTVIGVSYILAFNVPPVELTGTATILVLAFVFRNMPVGIRAGLASLAQIDRSLDEASATLRARSFRTLRLVLLPILRPAVVAAMVYSFVRAITSVSAVIFLTTADYNLATVYIVGRAEIGEHGIALVYSTVLILVMALALVLIRAMVGEQKIGRRSAMVGS